MFELVSKYKPSGDQPEAIEKLVDVIEKGKKEQVLLVLLITLAIVKVLPVPVAPNNTCSFFPFSIPSTNFSIASG